MNILITSAGRRVSLLKSFKTELQIINPESKVFAIDSAPMLSAACQMAHEYFEAPRLDTPDYIEFLLGLCLENNIGIIIPTIDTELVELSKNRERFLRKGIYIIVSSFSLVSKCVDKRKTHEFLVTRGVKVAEEYSKTNFKTPLFIKPVNGSRSIDTFVINTKEELTSNHFKDDKFMFLEYLNHDLFDEYTCDMYYGKDHQLKCVVPRKRLEVREGEVYKALTANNELVPYIQERLHYVEGAIGCLTAQFFMHKNDQKNIYGIEINPRFGGGYPLTYLSGANFTKWILEEYILEKSIEEKFEVWENNLLMIRYDHEVLVHGYKG